MKRSKQPRKQKTALPDPSRTTILTVMTGRWYALEPYLYGLLNLRCDPSKVDILWYTNAQPSFFRILEDLKVQLSKKGFNVQIVYDDSIPPLEWPQKGDMNRYERNLKEMTALYNAAWQYISTDDVLFVEDDTIVPSEALDKLKKVMDMNEKASLIGSGAFDFSVNGRAGDEKRWEQAAWNVYHAIYTEEGDLVRKCSLNLVKNPWGIRKVDAVTFICALTRISRLPPALKKGSPFAVQDESLVPGDIVGYDIIFSFALGKYDRQVFCHFDVRPLRFRPLGEVV